METTAHRSGISWVKNSTSNSACNLITQFQPGKFLKKYDLRKVVILCVDCSGSMFYSIDEAKEAAKEFIHEALTARYEVGFIWWNTGVEISLSPTKDEEKLHQIIDNGIADGGTDITETLKLCIQIMQNCPKQEYADRVIAVIGDGDLGEEYYYLQLANELCTDEVRIVTRGIGAGADNFLRRIECSCLGHSQEDRADFMDTTPREATDSAKIAISMLSAELHKN